MRDAYAGRHKTIGRHGCQAVVPLRLAMHTMIIRAISMLCISHMEARKGEGGREGKGREGKGREDGKEGQKGGRKGRKEKRPGREQGIDQEMKDIPACPVSLDKVKMATSDGPYSTGAGMGVNWGQ